VAGLLATFGRWVEEELAQVVAAAPAPASPPPASSPAS
jgi:hypothetical protein